MGKIKAYLLKTERVRVTVLNRSLWQELKGKHSVFSPQEPDKLYWDHEKIVYIRIFLLKSK